MKDLRSRALGIGLGLLLHACTTSAARIANLGPLNVDYVYFESSSHPAVSGWYIQNTTAGLMTGGNCGVSTNVSEYSGTYFYDRYDGGYRMWERYLNIGDKNEDHLIYIGSLATNGGYGNCPATYYIRTKCASLHENGKKWSLCSGGSWKDVSSGTVTVTSFCQQNDASCNSPTPTQTPTATPSGTPTKFPTTPLPTASPIPTTPPTVFTSAPSQAPTTPEPTSMPIGPRAFYNQSVCPGLQIIGLQQVFSNVAQTSYLNLLDEDMYRSADRRMWSNGKVWLYFSYRWDDYGEWVISNRTYAITRNGTKSADSNVPVDDDTDGVLNYMLWDHFALNNVYQPLEKEITLVTTCKSAAFPTPSPSVPPTTSMPSVSPTSSQPTPSPTSICTRLNVNDELNSQLTTCADHIADVIVGSFARDTNQYLNERPFWKGFGSSRGNSIFYSNFFGSWVIDLASEGYGAVMVNPSVPGGTITRPPKNATWEVFSDDRIFDPDCDIQLLTACSSLSVPTPKPTPSPIPTTSTPSMTPTDAPTRAPTQPPTGAPTWSPTPAPTSAPIEACGGMIVRGTGNDELDGQYQLSGSLKNGKAEWFAIYSDATIFWSTAANHQTWVMNSYEASEYFLCQLRPPDQPPALADWDHYLGSSPFVASVNELNLTCQANGFPTPAPTDAPTHAPTQPPTRSPSAAPTQPPTNAPTQPPTSAPSVAPSDAPSSAPTNAPTQPPTMAPTGAPTRSTIGYILIESEDDPRVNGYYAYTSESQERGVWVSDDNSDFSIYYDAPYWFLDLSNGAQNEADTYVTTHNNWFPPESAEWQQYMTRNVPTVSPTQFPSSPPSMNPTMEPTNSPLFGFTTTAGVTTTSVRRRMQGTGMSSTEIYGPYVNISIEYFKTLNPTMSPTFAPTSVPTESPTSPCRGLQVMYDSNDLDSVYGFAFDGQYARGDYLVNNKHFWYSAGRDVSLQFTDGNWYFLYEHASATRGDRLLAAGDDTMFPPLMTTWTYARKTSSTIDVTMSCTHTGMPSVAPTTMPTPAPTDNEELVWEKCEDDRTYFGFVGVSSAAEEFVVYWDVPQLNVDDSEAWLTVTYPDYASGDALPDVGLYSMVYEAEDTFNNSATCTLTIVLLKTMDYVGSEDYCVDAAFSIQASANESFFILDESTIASSIIIKEYVGVVRLPEYEAEYDVTCVASVDMLSTIEMLGTDDSSSTAQVLGNDNVGDVLTIVILLWIVILTVLVAYRWFVAPAPKQEEEDKDRMAEVLESERLEVGAGIAPARMIRKATLTSLAMSPRGEGGARSTGSPVGSGSRSTSEPGGVEMTDVTKSGWEAVDIGSAPPPSMAGADVEEDGDPSKAEFWRAQLDELHTAGFKNEQKNLQFLNKYLQRTDGKIDKEGTVQEVKRVLFAIWEKKKKEKAAKADAAEKQDSAPPPLPPTPGDDPVIAALAKQSDDEDDSSTPDAVLPMYADQPPAPVPPPVTTPPEAYAAAAPSKPPPTGFAPPPSMTVDDESEDELVVPSDEQLSRPRPSGLDL
jgi:hypothetical protein